MKIAIVGPTHPYKGGIAQHTTELARRLTAAGHDVVIESWRRQDPAALYPGRQRVAEAEYALHHQVREDLAWNRPDSWVRCGHRLRDRDLIVFVMVTPFQLPIYMAIRRSARARRAQSVAICHNALPHEPRWFDPELVRRFLHAVPTVVAHSDDEAKVVTEMGATDVSVASLPFFLPALAKHPGGEPHSRGRLLFFGYVRPYKGLDVLISAVAAAGSTPSLLIAGEFWGGAEAYVEQARVLGLGDRCTFKPGYLAMEELPGIVASCDALIVPYRTGTGSQHPRIAHLHGRPVVGTRVGDLPLQIRHGVDGLLCEPDDVGALAAAIDELYLPGVLERLTAGVRPPNVDAEWNTYLDALLGTAT